LTFATPLLLALLPVTVALLVWRFWRRAPSQPALAVADASALLAARGPDRGWRVRLRWVPTALRVCALLTLVVALARPQRGLALTFIPEQGVDLVLAFDLSGSMQQPTRQANGRAGPSRLEAARTVINDFVSSLEGDRVGLVIFQSRSLVMSPLTVDRAAVQQTVSKLEPGLLPDGTAIGLGLAEALNLIRGSEARSRVVVLLTDGQNNSGEVQPLQAAQLAKTLGIRVYTIGFVERGEDIDAATLRQIATETGATYYDASNQAELATAYEEISALERSRVGERRFTHYQELAPWLAGVAVVLLILDFALRATVLRRYP
jgi:Ca-activated chloride channel family protein